VNLFGHVRMRRGVLNHLRLGRMTLKQKGAFETIVELADWQTGVWFGSARALSAICGAGDLSEREARTLLESLEKARPQGYIRRFVTPGHRGNYPIVVHKYEIRVGEVVFRVNAWKTEDWKHPELEPCEVEGEVDVQVDASLKEVRSKKKERGGKPSPRKKREADPRHHAFWLFATAAYAQKFGEQPNWNGRQAKRLGESLAAMPAVTSAELQRRFFFFLESTDDFISKTGHGLDWFCEKFNALRGGPILKGTHEGKNGNGTKPSHGDAFTSTAKGLQRALASGVGQ
jgi:hypothetical protein